MSVYYYTSMANNMSSGIGRPSRHTFSVFYSRNYLLVFNTSLLVLLCVIIDIGLYGAAEPL